MTPYYLTFAALLFLLMLAQATQPAAHFKGDVASARRVSGFFLLCAASLLVLFAGLRYKVGTDYTGYVRNYALYKSTFVDDLRSFNEPGIKALATATSWVWDNPTGYILLSSVVTVGLLLRTYAKYSPSVAFSFIIFALAGPWVGSFNGVRQYLACAVLVAGHRFILDRKPMRFVLVVLLAGMFHQSALAAILLYAVPRRRLGLFGLLFVVTLSLVLLNSSEAVLGLLEEVKGESLTTPYVTSSINPLRIAVAVAPLALYALTPRGSSRTIRTSGSTATSPSCMPRCWCQRRGARTSAGSASTRRRSSRSSCRAWCDSPDAGVTLVATNSVGDALRRLLVPRRVALRGVEQLPVRLRPVTSTEFRHDTHGRLHIVRPEEG